LYFGWFLQRDVSGKHDWSIYFLPWSFLYEGFWQFRPIAIRSTLRLIFPSKTTSQLQPMDLGIIKSFKFSYKMLCD
jgi:hypothetical protein